MKQTDKNKWSGILVYIECFQGKVQPVSLELVGEAYRLSGICKEPVCVVAVGAQMERVKEQLTGLPVLKAFLYETEDEYDPELYEKLLTQCIWEIRPSIVLIGGTWEGRALAPRAAVAFRTGLTADCTELSIDENGNLVQTRPAFGGNVMASIVTETCRPQFATVRPGMMMPVTKDFTACTIFQSQIIVKKDGAVRILGSEPIVEKSSITDQKILVVAGRGIRKKEDLDILRELAALLGGKLASSRALVEKGWMKPDEQIGLSGSTVSPEWMITCGVSGTVQFMAGMKHTKNIIAINSDPNARIFEIAHYPVCGDLYEIVPELIEILKKKGGGTF